MPVAWEQLPTLKSGAQWTIATAREYLSFQKDDPWADYWKASPNPDEADEEPGPRSLARSGAESRLAVRFALSGLPRCKVVRMAARSIASLSLSFGLVSIPVKLYSATESAVGVSFNLLHNCGSRVKQQYLCMKENVVGRARRHGQGLRVREGPLRDVHSPTS